MIQVNTIQFLKDLEKNNSKSWFDVNRARYEAAREAFLESVDAMIKAIAIFEPAIGEQTAKQTVFRINRDVRFSKDKRPYKNNMSAYFNAAGKKAIWQDIMYISNPRKVLLQQAYGCQNQPYYRK